MWLLKDLLNTSVIVAWPSLIVAGVVGAIWGLEAFQVALIVAGGVLVLALLIGLPGTGKRRQEELADQAELESLVDEELVEAGIAVAADRADTVTEKARMIADLKRLMVRSKKLEREFEQLGRSASGLEDSLEKETDPDGTYIAGQHLGMGLLLWMKQHKLERVQSRISNLKAKLVV